MPPLQIYLSAYLDISPHSSNSSQIHVLIQLKFLQHIDGINLFGLISIASLLYCAPLAILMEGGKWSGAYNAALAGVGKQELIKQMAVAGIFYHLYNQVIPSSPLYLTVLHHALWLGLWGRVCLELCVLPA